jgi:hypothetical protein
VRAACLLALTGCQLVYPLEPGPAPASACLQEGVELCLSFEDEFSDGETTDASGNGNDASLVAVSKATRKGHDAVSHDGNSTIAIKNVNTLNFAGPLTFEAFLRWSGAGADQVIVDNLGAYGITINNFGSVFCTFIFANGAVSVPSTAFMPGITANVWHHAACVFDPAVGTTVYLDGMPRQTDAATIGNTLVLDRGGRVRVGSLDDNTKHFLGDIDDVRISTRALTDAEILATVNAD